MSNKIRTIQLLLLDPSSNDAEQTINLLRNNGFAVRATQITSEDELKAALEKQLWDLLIAKPAVNEFSADKALRIIQHLKRDTPVLLLTDQYNSDLVLESLRAGYCDVVPAAEQERTRLVVAREFTHVQNRRRKDQAETTLKDIEKRCDLLLASSRDAIAYIHDGMHIYVNKAYSELFGYDDADDLASMPIMDLIDGAHQAGFRELLRDYANTHETKDFPFVGLPAEGENFDAILTLSGAKYDGEECTQVLIRRGADNAELEKRIKELSAIDTATGLFNRSHLLERVAALTERAIKQKIGATLILMDVDQFNTIKAKHGLAGTDELMREAATYLRRKLDDNILLARIGDDGFGALAPIVSIEEARSLGDTICREFAAHMFEVQHHTVKCTLSTGVILINDKTGDADQTMSHAHAALMLIKQKGGNGCKLFDPILIGNATDVDKKVLMAVQDALDSGRAHLLFQPMIKMQGERGSMYSALLRIQDDKGHQLSPDQIFPIAEQAGIAARLDRWVITQATKLLAQYTGKDKPKIFVNISGAALLEESLPSFIGQCLRASRLSPDALVFQISETDAQDHLKRCLTFLEGLRKVQGLSCLTSYGATEHASQLVKDLPIDFVRLDGKFAPQLSTNQELQEQLKKLLDTAHSANRRSIVPRVEDAGCLAKLWPLGVHYVQGYYLQAPSETMDYDFAASEF